MKNSDLLKACLLKSAADAKKSLAQSMKDRVGSWHSEDSEPKGLPPTPANTDETNVEYPTDKQYDNGKGTGWRTITGTGPGPAL